jgi:hypothetical protein
MRFVCRITKAKNTHSEYAILIAVARQQWLRERSSMLRLYPHCLSYVYVHSDILPILILLGVSAFFWRWNTARPKQRYQESVERRFQVYGLSLTDEPLMSQVTATPIFAWALVHTHLTTSPIRFVLHQLQNTLELIHSDIGLSVRPSPHPYDLE